MSGKVTRVRGAVAGAGTRHRVLGGVVFIAVVAAAAGPVWAAGAPAPAVAPAVAAVIQQIHHGEDCLGWSDLLLGMTLREVETALGRPIHDGLFEEEASGGYLVDARLAGTEIALEFSGNGPAAALECIGLRFPAPEDPRALTTAVREVVPDALYWRGRHSRGDPYVAEGDEDSPSYVIPGRLGYVILVHPREGGVTLCAPGAVD